MNGGLFFCQFVCFFKCYPESYGIQTSILDYTSLARISITGTLKRDDLHGVAFEYIYIYNIFII